MRTFSGSEKPRSAPLSRRLSPPSKHRIIVVYKTWLDTRLAHAPAVPRETSARKNASWLYNSAPLAVRKPAHQTGSAASALSQSFGTHPAKIGAIGEQSSYFSPSLALGEKIISSGPEAPTRSTDHVDNNKHPAAAAFLARHLGGLRRGDLHRSRRRGHLPARPLVIHVARDHRRGSTAAAATSIHRAPAWSRAALRHRLLRQADRADHQRLWQGASPRAAEHRICAVGDRDWPDHRQYHRRAEALPSRHPDLRILPQARHRVARRALPLGRCAQADRKSVV